MNVYYDGSVGGSHNQWLSLAGLVASDKTWSNFQTDWESMLADRTPTAEYIHMSDIVSGNDPFRRDQGWTEEKRQKLIKDAIQVLRSIDERTMCAFACSVDVAARNRLRQQGFPVSDPAVICAENGVGRLLNWYTETHRFELACLFYDQNEPFIKSIRTRWLRHEEKLKKAKVTSDLVWGRIAKVEPVTMRTTPPIQACDVIAWSVTRRLAPKGSNDQWATLADLLVGSRNKRGILTNSQLDPITEAIMRQKNPKP
jgi:hypothetical protein